MKIIKGLIIALLCIVAMICATISAYALDEKTDLVSMHYIDSDSIKIIEGGITDSYGEEYTDNVLEFNARNGGYSIYDLNGEYTSFEGSIVCSTDTASDAIVDVGIFADGELVYSLTNYTKQKPAQGVKLDLSGVGELAIKTNYLSGYYNSYIYIYFVESSFTKADKAESYPDRDYLSDQVIIDSGGSETSKKLFIDAFGAVHNEYASLSGNGYVLYNLDKKYTSFSGYIAADPDTGSSEVIDIDIFTDDKPVLHETGIKVTTKPIKFNIDVTNVSVLKIVTKLKETDVFTVNDLCITDGILKQHDHTVGKWKVETKATCSTEGKEIKICNDCGKTIETKKIPKEDHTPDNKWVTEDEATCNSAGKQVQHCTICKKVCETKDIDKLPHTPSSEWIVTKEATCGEQGLQVKKCTVCDEVCEEEKIPSPEHTYGDFKTISGNIWNTPIIKEHICTICGETETVENNSTSWVKLGIIGLIAILILGFIIVFILRKKKGLPKKTSGLKTMSSDKTNSKENIEKNLGK